MITIFTFYIIYNESQRQNLTFLYKFYTKNFIISTKSHRYYSTISDNLIYIITLNIKLLFVSLTEQYKIPIPIPPTSIKSLKIKPFHAHTPIGVKPTSYHNHPQIPLFFAINPNFLYKSPFTATFPSQIYHQNLP